MSTFDKRDVGFVAQELDTAFPGSVAYIDTEAIEQARNTITFTMGNASSEMIRISPEGFWIRGVKVEQDEKEAKIVYEAFKQWLVWSELTRN